MKTNTLHQQHGLSRVEVSFAILTISLLLFFFLVIPCALVGLGNAQRKAQRISCLNNLRQVGLGMRLFANDHENKFPWMIGTNLGGSLEFTNSSLVFRHFLSASNELLSAKILTCPLDSGRTRQAGFADLSDSNLSYFVALDANPGATNPAPSILSGDRNILGGTVINGTLRSMHKSDHLSWSKEIHQRAGNLVLADGSTLQVNDSGLNRTVAAMTNVFIRLAIP